VQLGGGGSTAARRWLLFIFQHQQTGVQASQKARQPVFLVTIKRCIFRNIWNFHGYLYSIPLLTVIRRRVDGSRFLRAQQLAAERIRLPLRPVRRINPGNHD
jgi:hypothetical protein